MERGGEVVGTMMMMRWIKEYRSYSQNSEKNDVANRIGSSRPN
jgi:hypothetical protein